jgi:hypothetical protein
VAKSEARVAPSGETLGVNKSEAKFREFLVRETNTTTPNPLLLFFVSVDSTGVRERGLVSVESAGVEVPLE